MERVDLAPVAEHWNARALINRHFSAASVQQLVTNYSHAITAVKAAALMQ